MKVLGICCSPRVRANTEFMLKQALEAAREDGAEVELMTLVRKSVLPCDGCLSCSKTKKCHIKDDMPEIYSKLLEADGIIFGIPLYFGAVCAQAKALIDRTYVLWLDHSLKDKVGATIVTAEGGKGNNAIESFELLFRYQKMRNAGAVVGLSGAVHGKYGVEYPKDGVQKDKEALARAMALGKTVVERLRTPTTSS